MFCSFWDYVQRDHPAERFMITGGDAKLRPPPQSGFAFQFTEKTKGSDLQITKGVTIEKGPKRAPLWLFLSSSSFI